MKQAFGTNIPRNVISCEFSLGKGLQNVKFLKHKKFVSTYSSEEGIFYTSEI